MIANNFRVKVRSALWPSTYSGARGRRKWGRRGNVLNNIYRTIYSQKQHQETCMWWRHHRRSCDVIKTAVFFVCARDRLTIVLHKCCGSSVKVPTPDDLAKVFYGYFFLKKYIFDMCKIIYVSLIFAFFNPLIFYFSTRKGPLEAFFSLQNKQVHLVFFNLKKFWILIFWWRHHFFSFFRKVAIKETTFSKTPFFYNVKPKSFVPVLYCCYVGPH